MNHTDSFYRNNSLLSVFLSTLKKIHLTKLILLSSFLSFDNVYI